MNEISKAKEKAERYLHKIINITEDNLVNTKDYEYIPEGWPIQLEAYVYLGHKYKNLTKNLSTKVRNLWLNWANFYERKKEGYRKYNFFWPATEEFIIPVSHEDFETDEGHWIECHMSMFRARENLKIVGFDTYFEETKRRLEALLIEFAIFTSYRKNRILWQIVRSPNLCMILKDYLVIVANRLFDEEDLKKTCDYERKDFRNNIHFLIKASFFLMLFNIKDGFLNVSKKILIRLADEQDRNGSFLNDIISTCLVISALNISNIDSSGTISDKAIEWLLNKQKDQGYWKAKGPSWSYDLPEFDVLSTVLVLETIDLVTNNKPLALWAEKSKIIKGARKKKPSRVQTIRKFPTPSGITWEDISIRFTSSQVVQLRAGEVREGRNFIDMGFEDQRSHNPDWSWETLIEFGKNQGEISVDLRQNKIHPRILRNIKYYVMTIRQRLKELFNIKSDPFFPYNRKTKTYKLKCSVSVTEELY